MSANFRMEFMSKRSGKTMGEGTEQIITGYGLLLNASQLQ
jgi:hypothetical protein